jgi:VIT1/CCC1 family predicted Fe2+/Mn2+ transporter
MVAIAALSQNERTLRYIIDLPISSEEYNVWKSLFKLFLSINDEESVACGRMLESLTRRESNNSEISSYWLPMIDNGLLPTLIQIFNLSKNDDLLISAYLLLFNIINELPEVKSELKTIKNVFSSMLKHTRSTNNQILLLLGRVLACLSTVKSLIDSMVEQGLIESLTILIDKQRSPQIISSYFDCLANVVSNSFHYQQKLAYSKDFLSLITNVYLHEYDLNLSLSIIRFIRHLVKNNEYIQNILSNHGACEHLLGALSASSKELQQVSIEAIQALSHQNSRVQQLLLREHAIEQLLNLLEKTNLSNLQIPIVCTLWTLCENSLSRKREVATRIGIRKLISFYTIKSDEHLLAVTDAINELAKCPASIKMNIQEEINHAQGIPYLIRLLKFDDEMLVLSVLKTLQLISCAPGFVADRTNQNIILKNDGITLIVALMMHAKSELIQVEAAQSLACIALSMYNHVKI